MVRDFGEKLEEILDDKGISQRALAKSLEIPASTLNGYINGYREPNLQTIRNISTVLNVSTDELLDTEFKLKKKEKKLIRAFRALTKKQRKSILEKIEFMVLLNEIDTDDEDDDDYE